MYFFEDDDAVIFDYPTFNPAFKMNPEYKLLEFTQARCRSSRCPRRFRGDFSKGVQLGPLATGQGLNWKYSNINSTCSALLFSYVPRILISEVDEGSDCNLGFGSPPHSWMRYCLP